MTHPIFQRYSIVRIIGVFFALLALPVVTQSATTNLPIPKAATLEQQEDGTLYRSHEVFVKWDEELLGLQPEQKLNTALTAAHATPRTRRAVSTITDNHDKRNYSVVSSAHLSTAELVAYFENLPGVQYAHPNSIFEAYGQTTPWGVGNTTGVKAQQAHTNGETGSGVIVAVIDTGVDWDHADLAGNMWSPSGGNCTIKGVVTSGGCPNHGYDFVSIPEDNNPDDDHGHGTHVAGTIGAEDNTTDVVGVAPDVQIMAIKSLSNDGSGSYTDIVEGIEFAVDNGADVINMSLGSMNTSIVLQDLQDVIEEAEAAGVTVIAAAGNDSSSVPAIPAMFDTVVSVGAVQETTSQDNPSGNYNTRLAYFSNWGAVDVVAPGFRINSTTLGGGTSGDTWGGTSMASPHVAGVAALLKGADGTTTPTEIRTILQTTATDLGNTGKDEFFGSGLVNAEAAIAALGSFTKTILLEGNWSDNNNTTLGVYYYNSPNFYSTMQPADGSTTTTLRVRVATEEGTPVANESVTLSTTAGSITDGTTKTTDSNGMATFTYQAGANGGTATVTATIDSTSATDTIGMRLAETLLMTDAGQPLDPGNEGWYYIQALEAAGENWKQSQNAYPALDTTLDAYDKIVWHTEGYGLSDSEQSNIQDYLDLGGGKKIFVSGGDIAYTQYYFATYGGSSTQDDDIVLANYFNIKYADFVASDLTLVGDENFGGTGGTLADYGEENDNFYFSDVITTEASGTSEGYFCSNEETGIVTVDKAQYTSVFIAAALETVGKTEREELVQNALDFLDGTTQSGGTFSTPTRCDSSTTADDGSEQDPSETPEDDTAEPIPSLPESNPDLTNPMLLNAEVDAVTDTTATISWETDEDIVSANIYAVNTETAETEAFESVDTTGGTIDSLNPDTTYQFYLYGVYADETLTSASAVSKATLPEAPLKPLFQSKTRQKFTVELTDENETGHQFRVELRNKKKDTVLETQTLDEGINEATFAELSAKKTYYVRARLVYTNDDEEEIASDWSDYLETTTKTDQPTKLDVLKKNSTKIQIEWVNPPGKLKMVRIQVWKKIGKKYKQHRIIKVKKNLSKDPKKKWITDLKPDTRYRLRMRAIFKNNDKGRYSKYIKFKTQAADTSTP